MKGPHRPSAMVRGVERAPNAVILKIKRVRSFQAASARLTKGCAFCCEALRDLRAAIAGCRAQAGKGR